MEERQIIMDKYRFDVVLHLAESGITGAMGDTVYEILSEGKDSVTKEQADLIIRYLDSLVETGNHNALLTLGLLHYTGLGDFIPQDYVKAMCYYEKAVESSEKKNHWALNNLGYCYYYGRAGEADYKKAYDCFTLSAILGNPNAMYKLGDMYYHGYHVDKDLDASFYWYSFAKEQVQEVEFDDDYKGFVAASIAMRIGRAYLHGEGIKIDLFSALLELRNAEALFYMQILLYKDYSIEQLPKVQKLIKAAISKLNKQIKKNL